MNQIINLENIHQMMNKIKNQMMNQIKNIAATLPATLALVALIALTNACTGAEPDTTIAPGTATPEGGNQPGVEITLNHPVVTIATSQADAAARTAAARPNGNAATRSDITEIDLFADLLTNDGTVTQRSRYYYSSSGWTTVSGYLPLTVKGGEGNYYVRMAAAVKTTTTSGAYLYVSYTGTASVAADGSFTPNDALKPYDAQMNVVLKDADGTLLPTGDTYRIYLRGAARMSFKTTADGKDYLNWNAPQAATRPLYYAWNDYPHSSIGSDGTAALRNLMPGTVPATWNKGADAYSPADTPGTWGDTEGKGILLSIYKKGTEKWEDDDATTSLPKNDYTAVWHLSLLPAKSLTLDPGKCYTLTVQLNGRDINVTDITTTDIAITWQDGGKWEI